MKKLLYAFILLGGCLISCSDDENPQPTPAVSYMNMKTGSTWNYEATNNQPPASTTSYTVTSTDRDSTINGNNFHVFTNSATAASSYYRVNGADYFTFQALPAELGGSMVENLYLKAGANVNATWAQTYNITYSGFPFAVTLTNTIAEKGISRNINGTNFTDVIHVTTSISIAAVPDSALTTSIHYYYAPNYGMIENSSVINFDYPGFTGSSDVTTKLQSATLVP